MKIAAIIPARYASTRFPGKPLVDLNGKSMIQRVYEQVSLCEQLTDVIVATDHQEIYDHVLGFGGKVVMTKPDHPSGTDRVNEVLQQLTGIDALINVQGDEPFIPVSYLNQMVEMLQENELCTLVYPLAPEDVENVNKVKAVFNNKHQALYFSRSPIPYNRDGIAGLTYYGHIGVYGYHVQTLQNIAQLPTSYLENVEKLEQLRWLEAGFSIKLGVVENALMGIDTPEDAEKARAIYNQN